MEIIEKKLEILYQKRVINKKVLTITQNFINAHKEEVKKAKIDLFDMMVTHLAMFLKRVFEDTQLNSIDINIVNSLKQDVNYNKANKWLETHILQKNQLVATEEEKAFLIMHILNTFFN